MKTVISAIVIVVLMIGAPAVYAETAYQSGFKHGVADGKLDEANKSQENYIHQPGNGFNDYSDQFNNGYIIGWCSITGPISGKETDNADFDCADYINH